MGVPFSQMPDDLLMDSDITLSAIRAWHVVYCETLGRPGWDLSYSQIAKAIGSDRRTAIRAVSLLLDKGWLARIRQKDSQGDDAANLFAICREPHVPWNSRTSAPLGSDTDVTTGTGGSDTADTRGSDTNVTLRDNHLPVEQHGASDGQPALMSFSSQTTSVDLFDTFWAEYPRDGRVESKKATKEAWATALKKDSPTNILAGLRRQLPYMRQQIRDGSNFNKHAKRWLSGELWKEAAPQVEPQRRGSPSGVLIPDDNYKEHTYKRAFDWAKD